VEKHDFIHPLVRSCRSLCGQIRGLPTLVFVSKEKEKLAKRTEGILPVEALKELHRGLVKQCHSSLLLVAMQ